MGRLQSSGAGGAVAAAQASGDLFDDVDSPAAGGDKPAEGDDSADIASYISAQHPNAAAASSSGDGDGTPSLF